MENPETASTAYTTGSISGGFIPPEERENAVQQYDNQNQMKEQGNGPQEPEIVPGKERQGCWTRVPGQVKVPRSESKSSWDGKVPEPESKDVEPQGLKSN